MKEKHAYTLLCLGDSYTIGEAVEEKESFPAQTVELLRARGIDFEQPVIIAKTGWTTDELLHAIKEKNLEQKFDFVTLLIGVNNQYRNRDLENYREEFKTLLNIAIDYANGNRNRIFVISIPDWSVTPFAAKDKRSEAQISEEIDVFNSINENEAANEGANYVDITFGSRKAKNDLTLLAKDGLHPSEKMYAEWAKTLAKKIDGKIEPIKENANDYLKYSGIGFQIIGITGVGMFIGYRLDKWLHFSQPYLATVFAVVFLILALYMSLKNFGKN